MILIQCLITICLVRFAAALGQQQVVSFDGGAGTLLLGSSASAPQIVVDASEWPGVTRAANDLAADFGRVTGTNGTITTSPNSTVSNSSASIPIIVGTLGQSNLIINMVSSGIVNVSAIEGQWEAFQTQVVQNPIPGVANALVIVGSYGYRFIVGIMA
jgi:hypothetical protein